MASAYRPFSPSTGPGYSGGVVPAYATFQLQGISASPGTAFASNLGPQTNPNPGPPAPASDNGILLESSWNEFIAMESGSGGPTDHLVVE